MSDTDLYVNYELLKEKGNTISSNCTTISNNIADILDTINNNWSGWSGEDNTAYISSFKKTLNILTKYIEEYNNISTFLIEKSNEYSSLVNTCLEGLNNE